MIPADVDEYTDKSAKTIKGSLRFENALLSQGRITKGSHKTSVITNDVVMTGTLKWTNKSRSQ